MNKIFSYLLLLNIAFSGGCKTVNNDGWAMNFKYFQDKERYKFKNSGRGWASNHESSPHKNRFNKADAWGGAKNSSADPMRFNKTDTWSAYFKPHYNVDRYCKNKGWSIDFRSDLNPERFNKFNSHFFVMPAPNYAALKFNDSFSTTNKTKQGAFTFNKKKKAVKEKNKFRFRSKPRTNDTFGPNVEKKKYDDFSYNKKKKRVTKNKKLFKRKKEKPYKRKEDMQLELFEFKP